MPFNVRNLPLPIDGVECPPGAWCWQNRLWQHMHLPDRYLEGPRGGCKSNPDYFNAIPSRELLASVDYRVAMNFEGIGPKGRKLLIDYLAEGGLKFRNHPEVGPPKPVSEKRVQSAIRLLERCGYTIMGQK